MSDPTDPHPSDLPPPPSTPPTEPMPVTPAAPGSPPGGAVPPGAPIPPVPPGEADTVLELEDERPWYKSPAGIIGIIVVIAALLGLGAWLIWGGDDDEPEPGVATLELTALDPSGATLDRGFTATVVGPADSPTAFEWILPTAGTGEERGGTTGSDGVITFSWAPDETVDDPNAWESSIVVTELVPAGFTPPGPTVPCVLQRVDDQDTTITMTVSVDPPDTTVDQLVGYTFENHVFLPGDRVACELVSTPPPPTTTSTTVPETTTTEPETTTTVPETTTTAPETTTTVAETTTTAPETTTTVAETTTTIAPVPATTYEALEQLGVFTVFLSLVDQVPAADDLLRGSDPVTVLAPTDDALSGVTPPADPDELEQLLLSHIVDGEALDSTLIFDGRTEIDVATGGTQPVDPDATTIAGVGVVVEAVDLAADNGVAHGIAGVLPVAAP